MPANIDNPAHLPYAAARPLHTLLIESFGVSIMIESNSREAIAACRTVVGQALPTHHRFRRGRTAQHQFTVIEDQNRQFALQKNGRPFFSPASLDTVIGLLASQLRSIVAEFAEGFVFIHAGVVAVNGRAVVIPADSMAGKTTLVVELIKRGAIYYSDEFAVIDAEGLVRPFPKTLSIRGEKGTYEQTEYSAEDLGGKTGKKPVPVGLVLFTEFKESAEWAPIVRTPSAGVLDLLACTISARTNPEFALSVLKTIAEKATFIKTPRGEASSIADQIIAIAGKPEQ